MTSDLHLLSSDSSSGSPSKEPRSWLPTIVAVVFVLIVASIAVFVLEHGRPATKVTPISAQPDPYAANLAISRLALSESYNLAGGKVTYLDGQIANTGSRTVASITVQVLFRDMAHEVAQNETQPLKFIRIREPYIDLEPVSAAPLVPGAHHDFRLIFDAVSPDWDGAYPELRIVRVESK